MGGDGDSSNMRVKEWEREKEPLLAESSERFCMFPIQYQDIWEMYKKHEASFWTGTQPPRSHRAFPFQCTGLDAQRLPRSRGGGSER